MSSVTSDTYAVRRGQLETYFDRTAAEAWSRLTSDAPVNRVRATVREGRDRMRATLLDYLPMDLSGRRILDAGCGTGALAIEAARRGAAVTAIDLSATLTGLASERLPEDVTANGGSIDFRVGDMLDTRLGEFDHVVAMDSLIHYNAADIVGVLEGFAARTRVSMAVTVAPRTKALDVMLAVGRLFPRQSHRAPAIAPIAEDDLRRRIDESAALTEWSVGRTEVISSGFYKSRAVELHQL